MCTQAEPAAPSSTVQALAMIRAGLGYIASYDAAELGTAALAEALIGLEQAEAQHTAARAKMLAAFSAQQGHHADGQYGPAASGAADRRGECVRVRVRAGLCPWRCDIAGRAVRLSPADVAEDRFGVYCSPLTPIPRTAGAGTGCITAAVALW